MSISDLDIDHRSLSRFGHKGYEKVFIVLGGCLADDMRELSDTAGERPGYPAAGWAAGVDLRVHAVRAGVGHDWGQRATRRKPLREAPQLGTTAESGTGQLLRGACARGQGGGDASPGGFGRDH